MIGNDAVMQAEEFNKAVGIDATILTKVDADVKGGSALSVTFVTQKPILFIGVGQTYKDLELFNPEQIRQHGTPIKPCITWLKWVLRLPLVGNGFGWVEPVGFDEVIH